MRGLVLACFLCLVVPAWAGQPLGLALESFQWEERQDGTRLLREQGQRLVLSLEQGNLGRAWPGGVFFAQGRAYFGRVAYDGQSQGQDPDGQWRSYPLRSHTDYLGGEARLLAGPRLGRVASGALLDVYLGLAYRLWLRDIHGGVDDGGRQALGYREIYRQWDAQAGLGLARPGPRPAWFAFGLSQPLVVSEWVSLGGQVLHPQPRPGAWLALRAGLTPSLHLALDVYLDRLAASPVSGEVFQPDSEVQRLGVGLLWIW